MLLPGPNETLERGLYLGDCRDLASSIDDASIDLILCDPVYSEMWQYAWVARLAARVLKPGRSVLAQAGHIHRFEAECSMANAGGLVHRPLLQEVMTGGFGRNWMHKALRTSQPWIWFTRSDESPYNWKLQYHKWVRLSFFGSRDKSRFVWGDGERAFVYLIETFSRPGDIVLDPFSGTGTVASACAKLGRSYIGFEMDESRLLKSRDRLQTVQMPLFEKLTISQSSMFTD